MRRLRVRPDIATIRDDEPSEAATELVETGPVLYVAALPAGPIHVVGGSALVIWESVDGRTPDEVVETVAAAYDLSAETVRADVLDHLERLRHDGLIEDDKDDA